MKTASAPNLNRETTSITRITTNSLKFFQDPNHHDDTTLNKRPKIEHSEDTEASETSPFKDILSPILPFNEMNENHFPIDGSFYRWDQMDRTLPRWPPSPNGSDTNVSVGSNQFIGEDDVSKAWWEQCNHPDFPLHSYFPEDEFRRAFRMSKSTFDFICRELDPILPKKATMLRLATPVRKRVAVCIWLLATGESLRLVSKRFGIGIFTCRKLVREVCYAIRQLLIWPDEERMKGVKREFELVCGIPNVVGSMYTTHVHIIKPKVAAYFKERNQNTFYSITLQGVVDSKGVFTDVRIGWPGSMSDDSIFEKSALCQRVLCQRTQIGLSKDVWIVGNSGYPLMDWVLVPYAQPNLPTEKLFNEKVGEVQRMAKEAFSRLKERWSYLKKRSECSLEDLPVVVGACCVLHNICEMRNEVMDPSETSSFDLFDDEILPQNEVWSVAAMQARDQIAHHLAMPMV